MSDLLPCPMCGSTDVGGASGIVHCYRCGVNIKAATTDIAAKQWNTRATPPGMIKTEESHQRVIDAVSGARKSWLKQGMLPDGYKVVPVEPTEAMLKAAFGGDDNLLIGHADIAENAIKIYKAMIEAAD